MRLAIIVSHAIQYYSPWFRYIANQGDIDVQVFYLWDYGSTQQHDKKFNREILWDVPLLDGYQHKLVPNTSRNPGTHRFGGLVNPELLREVLSFGPDAVLLFGYAWRSNLEFIYRRPRSLPVMIRGDSHALVDAPRRGGVLSAFRRLLVRSALRRCDLALSVGWANSQFYRRYGVPEHRICHVPHCVDNDRFAMIGNDAAGYAFRQRHGIPKESICILFVGKFERKKRPDLLVEAFRGLDDPTLRLLILGDGSLASDIKRFKGDDSRIQILPFHNQSELPAVYAAADLLVLPSEGPQETWGLVVNESMNCRCAVAVSSHVGCGPDLVRNGANGWIFEAGSLTALRECLQDAVSDKARLRHYGVRSSEIISEYSYAVATTKLCEAMRLVT